MMIDSTTLLGKLKAIEEAIEKAVDLGAAYEQHANSHDDEQNLTFLHALHKAELRVTDAQAALLAELRVLISQTHSEPTAQLPAI